jgi:acyl carrier protein
MSQKIIDRVAKTCYLAIGVGGCLASVAFVLAGGYGAVSENTFKSQLFFVVLAVVGMAVGNSSFRFLRYVWKHNDLPTDDLGVVDIVIAIEKAFDKQIPERDAERMSTPRDVIDWLLPRVEGKTLSSAATAVLLKCNVKGEIDLSSNQVWTRESVSAVVMAIIAQQMGSGRYTEDSRFIGDTFA